MSVGDDLRDLAMRIQHILVGHRAQSVAGPVVHNCLDHLTLMARLSDCQTASRSTEPPSLRIARTKQ